MWLDKAYNKTTECLVLGCDLFLNFGRLISKGGSIIHPCLFRTPDMYYDRTGINIYIYVVDRFRVSRLLISNWFAKSTRKNLYTGISYRYDVPQGVDSMDTLFIYIIHSWSYQCAYIHNSGYIQGRFIRIIITKIKLHNNLWYYLTI